ncbi:MAG: amino acid ABC transporter permease [Actinomycetota bacterium]|nr:amino acid ABC transporter permease [Actinomycetota bacterium]
MSTAVLFDVPGPAARARHRLYTVLAAVGLFAVVAFAVWRLYEADQLEYELWEPFVTPDYISAILEGLFDTLRMAFTAVIAAVVFGVVFGVGKLSDHAVVRWPCWLVVEFFRAVPVLLLMVFCFYAVFGGITSTSTRGYWAVVLALTLYNGAVLAEVFRAGVNAVPKGQAEAAYAIGMRKSQVMNIVLLPQAVKIMIPAIISQCVVALKDTSLGYYILAPGLTYVARPIYQEFANHVPTILVVSAMYVVVNLILTVIATWVQRKFVGEKKAILQVSMVGEEELAKPS